MRVTSETYIPATSKDPTHAAKVARTREEKMGMLILFS